MILTVDVNQEPLVILNNGVCFDLLTIIIKRKLLECVLDTNFLDMQGERDGAQFSGFCTWKDSSAVLEALQTIKSCTDGEISLPQRYAPNWLSSFQ